MKKISALSRIHHVRNAIVIHKGLTAIVVITCVVGAFGVYHSAKTGNTAPQYVVAAAHIGTLTQTVAGSGQVSASNQTDIQSQVSGTIQSINVTVGQTVNAGQLIATIDPTNASIALKNAQIAFEKLTQAPKTTDLSNAQNSVTKSYTDTFNAISAVYSDTPAIMGGLKDMLYSQSGYLSDQHETSLLPPARAYRQTASDEYDKATIEYQNSIVKFKNISRTSATSTINDVLADTSQTIKDIAQVITDTQNTLVYIGTYMPLYDPKGLQTAQTSVNAWSSQANADISAIVGAQNSIDSSQNSLTTLITGADTLDIASAHLNLEQAQRTYDNYFIRAPYDGIIGRIPVNIFGQAGGSTVIATIIGAKKIATISLNEVDAAKVKAGQPVTISFDAIDGLNATGTVSQIDQVGTVSNGVVSYGVKMAINTTDDRIKPGMSVNTTIITNQEDNVLLVPSSAVKTQGNTHYVQTFDSSLVTAAITAQTGTTTRKFNRPIAISPASTVVPAQVPVMIGDSDDTNTVITSGLDRGSWVIVKTVNGTTATTATPNILSTLGGNRGGAGGGAGRIGGGGGAAGAGR